MSHHVSCNEEPHSRSMCKSCPGPKEFCSSPRKSSRLKFRPSTPYRRLRLRPDSYTGRWRGARCRTRSKNPYCTCACNLRCRTVELEQFWLWIYTSVAFMETSNSCLVFWRCRGMRVVSEKVEYEGRWVPTSNWSTAERGFEGTGCFRSVRFYFMVFGF